jgi:hypothetical protein
MEELRPGLYRWTARHPEWVPGAPTDSPLDWPQEVGCVAYARETVTLIDPLVDDWEALDALVAGRPVCVLLTLGFHARSRDTVVERYPAGPAAGVQAIEIPDAGETMYWLPQPRALVAGDRLIGGPDGLRMCPDSWMRYLQLDQAGLRERLRAALSVLPVELVLVSHGEPVLQEGRAALERALA